MKDSCDIVPIGGRIKAAAVGMDLLSGEPPEVDEKISSYRKKPPKELLTAFFPHSSAEIKQFLDRLGIYRPILKTDQGMPGNFLHFLIDQNLDRTDLKTVKVEREEGLALPEPHCNHSADTVTEVQSHFRQMNLHGTFEYLRDMERRTAEKGRSPYFFIRAAASSEVPVFGQDIVQNVASKTKHRIEESMGNLAIGAEFCGLRLAPPNFLYVQTDAYITPDGDVSIERVHCPDVGMFLEDVDVPNSEILPPIRAMMTKINLAICASILRRIKGPLTIVTRDEVIRDKEDMLEQGEIAVMARYLRQARDVSVLPVSQIERVPRGGNAILMNIDYTSESARNLFHRYDKGDMQFFPNPYMQIALNDATELPEKSIEAKYRGAFLELAGSLPKNDAAIVTKIKRLRMILAGDKLDRDVLHAMVGKECIPILTNSSHSWRAFATRCERYPDKEIRLRAIPLSPKESLLDSSTGKRMHVYRFASIVS